MSKDYEMSSFKRRDDDDIGPKSTSADIINADTFSAEEEPSSAGRRTKLLIENDNQTLSRLGKVPVLKVRRGYIHAYLTLCICYT